MRLRLSPKSHQSELKGRQNFQIDKEELKETLQQIKILKIKTNNRIQGYQKVNEQQRQQIQILKHQLQTLKRQKEESIINNPQISNQMAKIKEIKDQNIRLKETLDQKQILVQYLRGEVQQFQKKYYQAKEQMDQTNNQKQLLLRQLKTHKSRMSRLHNILGTNESSDLQQFSFLQNSSFMQHLQKQKQSKLETIQSMELLSSQLKQKQHTLFQLESCNNQLKQHLGQASQKNQQFSRAEKELKQVQIHLKSQLDAKQWQISKMQDQTLLLKSSILELTEQAHRQTELLEQHSLRQQEGYKQSQLHLEYNILMDQILNQKQEFSIVNSEVELMNMYKMQNQGNIRKIQFLCQQIDSQ